MNSVLAKICPETLCFSGTSSMARLLPDALNGWARFIKQPLLRGEKCFSSYYHAACEPRLSVQRAAQSTWNSVLLSGFCLLGSFKWGVGTDPTALAKWGVWSWPKTNLRPWRSKKNEKQLPCELSSNVPGWSSGPCVPSWLPPSPFGMTLKSLLMLPANVIIFPPWVVLRSTPGKDLRGWRWMLFQQRAQMYLLVLPSSMPKAVRVLLWQALSHSERKRCPVPKASTTAHRVTVLLQLISSSLIQLNSACIILLLFM